MRGKKAARCYTGKIERVDLPAGEVGAELGLPSRRRSSEKLVVGRREWVTLPELGVGPLNAKTDSGARSSSLHAEEIELSEDGRRVSFTTRDHYGRRRRCEVGVGGVTRVKSSTGEAKPRIWIEAELELAGGFRWRTRLTLANRAKMLCPMLLGRRGLSGYFLIDTSADHLTGGLEHREH